MKVQVERGDVGRIRSAQMKNLPAISQWNFRLTKPWGRKKGPNLFFKADEDKIQNTRYFGIVNQLTIINEIQVTINRVRAINPFIEKKETWILDKSFGFTTIC